MAVHLEIIQLKQSRFLSCISRLKRNAVWQKQTRPRKAFSPLLGFINPIQNRFCMFKETPSFLLSCNFQGNHLEPSGYWWALKVKVPLVILTHIINNSFSFHSKQLGGKPTFAIPLKCRRPVERIRYTKLSSLAIVF